MVEGELVDGRFRLVKEIGAGGMGVVFRAIDEHAGEMVAVKLLEGQTPYQLERAHREIEVLARLSHPAIVRHIADGLLPDGSLYVAMEWVDGVTVARRIEATGLSLREAVAMVRGVAGALAAAHRAEVLHRDLKPSNIILAGGDPASPKLIDFGVARVRDAVLALTLTGVAVGTPGYMSPEQARGERSLTPACDVFGLGCVLYECLTGKPAFSGAAAVAVMAKILFGEPLSLASVCPEAPPALVALVARMLAKAQRQRFPDAGAVVDAIDALGELPDGPRRSSRRLTADATEVSEAAGAAHCMVGAARSLDEIMEPPTAPQAELLEQAAASWSARLEMLANGAVVVHVIGDSQDAAHRAARIAIAMRRILPGWLIAISSLTQDPNVAADDGTALLNKAVMAAIFGKSDEDVVVVDPATAPQLVPDFAIEKDPKTSTWRLKC